jgi:hypothetical protein
MKNAFSPKVFFRYIALMMVTVFMLSSLTACSNEQEVKSEGMTITLNKSYKESTLANATWYYTSPDGLAMGIKSLKNDVEKSGLEVNSPLDYAEAYIRANNIPGKPKIKGKGKYIYFEHTRKVSGTEYKYLTCIYDQYDSYWVVTFACYKALYNDYKMDFFESADSVVFDE